MGRFIMREVPLYSPLLHLGIELDCLQKGSEASPSAPGWTSSPACLPDPVHNSVLGPYRRSMSRAI